jgi:hypothetical protein
MPAPAVAREWITGGLFQIIHGFSMRGDDVLNAGQTAEKNTIPSIKIDGGRVAFILRVL